MPTPYTLDNQVIPGEIVINLSGHPCYFAGTMHTAELFAQQFRSDNPIELPAETDSTPALCYSPERNRSMSQKFGIRFETVLESEMGGELASSTLDNYELRRAKDAKARKTMQTALDTCRAYVHRASGWLYLYGPTGVGKSHLAAATAHSPRSTASPLPTPASRPS